MPRKSLSRRMNQSAKEARKMAPKIAEVVHDRKAVDLLINAQTAVIDVEDPFDKRASITVLASVRDDILRRMRCSPNDPIDDVQLLAGRKWEADWQRAQSGHIVSNQFRERTQGGGVSGEILTDQQREAQRRLESVDYALGWRGSRILRDVLGRGESMETVSIKYRGSSGDRDVRFIRARFRECLETLVSVYGLGNRKVTA